MIHLLLRITILLFLSSFCCLLCDHLFHPRSFLNSNYSVILKKTKFYKYKKFVGKVKVFSGKPEKGVRDLDLGNLGKEEPESTMPTELHCQAVCKVLETTSELE